MTDNHDDDSGESTYLLQSDFPVSVQDPDVRSRHTFIRSPRFIITWLIMAIIVVDVAEQLAEAPQMRIFESIFCYQYWEQNDPSKLRIGRAGVGPGAIGGVDEQWCKLPQIQGKVAAIRGYQTMFDGIPSKSTTGLKTSKTDGLIVLTV